jgi:pimeloyl-ACP methyl ester carboxylesterase
MRLEVNGIGLEVDDQSAGSDASTPVVLVHGWPDTHTMWQHQIAALNGAGYRTIAPDLRGFGGSDKPDGVDQYSLALLVGDLLGVVDQLAVDRAHVVGHDWGAAIAWVFATLAPERVASVTALSVGHPSSFSHPSMAQREKSWYMLAFQFAGIAEQWLSDDDWHNFRDCFAHPEADEVAHRLADTAHLTATLNLYRANVPPEALLGGGLELPPVAAPAMGVWSDGDRFLLEAQMTGSADHVSGPWRYERIDGAGHWMTLEAPARVSELLVDFLATA